MPIIISMLFPIMVDQGSIPPRDDDIARSCMHVHEQVMVQCLHNGNKITLYTAFLEVMNKTGNKK